MKLGGLHFVHLVHRGASHVVTNSDTNPAQNPSGTRALKRAPDRAEPLKTLYLTQKTIHLNLTVDF